MRNIIVALYAVLCLSSCAISPVSGDRESAQRKFDAWVANNRTASWTRTNLGSWIVSSAPGDESKPMGAVGDYPFVLIDYSIINLDGSFDAYCSADTAKVLGTFDPKDKSVYYGPRINYRGTSTMYAGLSEVINTMNVGGSCRVVVPGWLLVAKSYATGEEYLSKADEIGDAKIFDFTIVDRIADVDAWELAKVKSACGPKADSLDTGVYYRRTAEPSDDRKITLDDEIYVNYICRRLEDGQGVDTNIKDSAKVFGIYSDSKSYTPLLINWAEEASELTMTASESKMIKGFATALFNMHPHESGTAYMTSAFGYSTSGSGDAIPGYCPLIFEISIVDKS
ncbi:MAG: FKBP-type peptidyl-prolyl cis-trans isomerase [Bacteroidales bacterium]|nr:FKBP-type peptidyl-prolyl cis-trans isomerase [Bacteroidales bacterium]